MRRVLSTTAAAVAVAAGGAAGGLLWRGRGTAGSYLRRTLSDRLSGATVESSVGMDLAAEFHGLLGRTGSALAVFLVAVAVLVRVAQANPARPHSGPPVPPAPAGSGVRTH
jgi:hypothetical protein